MLVWKKYKYQLNANLRFAPKKQCYNQPVLEFHKYIVGI